LLSIITYLDRVCISVAGPRMQEDLHISPEGWGWVVGAFAIAYGAFEIPSGWMGDRFGPRRVLTRIVLWWSAFTCLTGVVSNYFLLLLARFCFGAGEAGAYPNTSASISRWFPVTERARTFGIVWMASQVGAALSPILVVPIQMRYGWRASFYAFGLLGVVWSVVWYWWYRDHPIEKSKITEAELEEIGATSFDARHELPWRIAARSRSLWAILLVALTYCYAMYFFISWLHTYLVKGRGFSERDLLLSTLPFVLGAGTNGLGGFASDWLVSKFGLKRGRRATGIVGLSVAALCTITAVLTANKFAALALLALGYAGITFQQPAVWAVCLDIGRKHAGAVSASMNTAAQIGSFLLSISFGYLVRVTGSYDLPLIPVAVMLAIGAALWLKVDPTQELFPESATSALCSGGQESSPVGE
jgi:MFS family permease